MYSISNGFLVHELNDAAQRGVADIKVLLSNNRASGSETHWSRASAYNLSQAGLPVRWTSADFRFTHAKFIIIDGKTTIVKSANWAKSSIPPSPTRGNREWGVVINDQEVTDYFGTVFTNDWIISTEYIPDPGHFDELSTNIQKSNYPHPFNASTFVEEMVITPVLSPDTDVEAILNLIASANHTLHVQQMYIKMEWDGAADLFLEALIAATQREVTVKIILDGKSSGMNETAQYLIAGGAQVAFSNDTYFIWQHNKGVIMDGETVLISSINWSFESTHENREAGVIIQNVNVATYFEEIFAWDWAVAQQVELYSCCVCPLTVTKTEIKPETIIETKTEIISVTVPEIELDIIGFIATMGGIPLILMRLHRKVPLPQKKR